MVWKELRVARGRGPFKINFQFLFRGVQRGWTWGWTQIPSPSFFLTQVVVCLFSSITDSNIFPPWGYPILIENPKRVLVSEVPTFKLWLPGWCNILSTIWPDSYLYFLQFYLDNRNNKTRQLDCFLHETQRLILRDLSLLEAVKVKRCCLAHSVYSMCWIFQMLQRNHITPFHISIALHFSRGILTTERWWTGKMLQQAV